MPLTIELGTLAPNEKKNFDVLVTNSGGKPVQIETIEMSCGCLSVDNPRPVLAAKATTPIPFSFVAPSNPGHSEKMILFKPAKTPDVAWFVDVTADVYAERWASPGKIEFLYSDEPSQTQQSKTTRITSAKPALIDSISCDVPDIHCELEIQTETENDVQVIFNQSEREYQIATFLLTN
ncbi:hypothetical protein FACS1894170_05620 [Planctomycetales bacterium]|nr:hypothetical protein FACS1894170_05620 [Planctomycetales bacterium]